MPTVDRVQGASVAPEALPNVRATTTMTGRETAGLQRGLGDVQQVVTALGAQAQEKADTASLLEAQRKLGDYERTWFDPNNPDSVPNTKGKNAMGLVERIDPDFAKMEAELSGSLRSDRARAAFSKYAAGTRDSLLGRVNNYAIGETDKYVQAEFAAGITTSTDRAAQAALEGRHDDQVREVQNGLNIIGSQAKINGEPAEATTVRKQAFLSTVHATAVNGFLANGDVAGAGEYFHDNADDISPEVAGQLMARLRPMQLEYNAESIADGIESGRFTPSQQGIDTSVDSVWSAQINQESGNRQVDKNGRPITSSKGAIGVAQVMPATGPIAAQYAGVAWDPERFKTDKAYNEQIGKAYMQAQVDQFGSVPLGLAAYNAGPGAVQKWIKRFGDPRKGEISIDEFVSRIPYGETKEYVERILARSGKPATGGAGAAVAMDPLPANATLEQKLDRARSIPDLYQRRQVEQVLRQRHGMRKQAEAENEAAVLEKVNLAVYAAPIGTPFTKIPGLTPADVAFVTQKGHRDNYERIIQQRIEGTLPKTNEVLFDTLRRQSVEDQEGFAKQKNFILANSHQFATADYESLLSRVAAITDPKKNGERADWATEEQRVGGIVRDLGIKSDKGGAEERAAVARAYMEAEREFVQRSNGTKPTPEQKDAMAAQVKRNLAEARAGGIDIAKRATSAATFDVTASTRARAIARLRTKNGGREPTEAELVEYLSAATLNRTTR